MTTMTLAISGMTCGHCVSSVRSALDALPGVEVEAVRIGSAAVRLAEAGSVASPEAMLAAVREAGYEARIASHAAAPTEESTACGCDCRAPAAATLTELAVRSST